MDVLFLLQAWRCLSDCILLMNKLFATIGNCFCSLITQVFVVKAARWTHNISQWSGEPWCHPECHLNRTFSENETESWEAAPYFTQCWRWLTGPSAVEVKWLEKWHLWAATKDPWVVMLFPNVEQRSCVGMSWRLMSYWWWDVKTVVKRELGPLGRNNNGQQPQQWAQNGGKYPPKKNIQSRRKLLCCVLCHKQGNFGFLCS